jgi:nuclear transport factor 2 (NTF2) superfamily protein
MDQNAFKKWLSQYGKAWESLDPAAAVILYTEDAAYQETPFVAPMRGREALLRYWTHVCETQRDVRFGFEILGFSDDRGFASWWATFRRIPPDIYVELNGMFALTFDESGRCKSLREWWHRRDLPSA